MGTKISKKVAVTAIAIGLLLSGMISTASADEANVRNTKWGIRGALTIAALDNTPVKYPKDSPSSLDYNAELAGFGGNIGWVGSRRLAEGISYVSGIQLAPMYYLADGSDGLPEFSITEFSLSLPFLVQFDYTEKAKNYFFQLGFIADALLSSKASRESVEVYDRQPEPSVFSGSAVIGGGWYITPQLALSGEIVFSFSGGNATNIGLTYFVNSYSGK